MAPDGINALHKDILHIIKRHKAIIWIFLLCPLWGLMILILVINGLHDFFSVLEDEFFLCFYYFFGFFIGLVFIIGGIRFIAWFKKNGRYRISIPESFISLRQEDYPKLFQLIAETSAKVGVQLPAFVYLEEGTTTAVFVSAEKERLFNNPSLQLSLVMGMALVSQLTDDELRAVLLHEFGHFSQEALKSTYSVYVFGQLSRIQLQCFPEMYNADLSLHSMRKAVLESFVSTYTTIRLKFLRKIRHEMNNLSECLEYEADDIAVKHIDRKVLQRALFHASAVEHSWRVIEWGLGILRGTDDLIIDNPYLVLSLLDKEDLAYSSISPVIQRRISRLGAMDIKNQSSSIYHSEIREQTINKFFESISRKGVSIKAEVFYPWIKAGYEVFEEQLRKAKSVDLTVQMGRRLHRYAITMKEFEILIDGNYIGLGNIKEGFCFNKKIAPGRHIVTAYLPVSYKGIPFSFAVEEGKSYCIDFDYRFFKRLGYYEVFVSRMRTL